MNTNSRDSRFTNAQVDLKLPDSSETKGLDAVPVKLLLMSRWRTADPVSC